MKINITIWVLYDIVPWLEKMTKFNKKLKPGVPEKKIKEMCHTEFGDNGELLSLFDLVLDASQYSNLEIMGQKYLKY
jgi:hypothetical protein